MKSTAIYSKFLISEKVQKTVATFVVTFFIFQLSFAQTVVTVYDKETQETLPQATIEVLSLKSTNKQFLRADNFGMVTIPEFFTDENPIFILRVS
jgi:hypothetical protein